MSIIVTGIDTYYCSSAEMAELSTSVGTITLTRDRGEWVPVGDSLNMWASKKVQDWLDEDEERYPALLAAARAALA